MATSPKKSDGFARILSKVDLDKVKGPGMRSRLDEMEALLQDCWRVAATAPEREATIAFGKCCVRCTLWIKGKEKQGREPGLFVDLASIAEKFASDLKGMAVTDEGDGEDPSESIVGLDADKKTVALVQNEHMKQNGLYTCTKDHGPKIFQLTDFGDSHAVMTYKPAFGEAQIVQVGFDFKKWKVSRGEMTVVCDAAQVSKLLAQHATVVNEEKMKIEVAQALFQFCTEHEVTANDVAFALHPAAVFTLKKVTKKNALKLLPYGIVSKSKKKPEHKTYIEYSGLFWNIAPFKACSNFAQAEGVLSPFWWCKGTTEPELANMEWGHLKKDGMKIPCLQNCKPLAKEEQLMFLDTKAIEVAEANKKRKLGHP
ncbi:Uncharacterized protein SCF082_LOCUS31857 [Durusdinium trenchii]|uniref:Uncharacterized protein n=1 Tax=Durusdinium trenchii TaxID=1381693 RepID=A0ABP0NBM2_9DINO